MTDTLVLVEEVESDAVLPPLHHVVVEGRRVPAVAALSLIRLLPQRGPPEGLPEAVPGRGTGAAVVDGGVIVGVGGGGVDALVISIGAEQVVVVEVRMVGMVLLLDLDVVEHGGGGGQRGGCERRWQRGEGRKRRNRGRQRGGRRLWVMVRVVVVVVLLVVQVMVMVRGKVVGVLDVRAAAVNVVHVHHVRLVVLRLVVEDGGQVRDGRGLRVSVGVLERLRERVSGQGPG